MAITAMRSAQVSLLVLQLCRDCPAGAHVPLVGCASCGLRVCLMHRVYLFPSPSLFSWGHNAARVLSRSSVRARLVISPRRANAPTLPFPKPAPKASSFHPSCSRSAARPSAFSLACALLPGVASSPRPERHQPAASDKSSQPLQSSTMQRCVSLRSWSRHSGGAAVAPVVAARGGRVCALAPRECSVPCNPARMGPLMAQLVALKPGRGEAAACRRPSYRRGWTLRRPSLRQQQVAGSCAAASPALQTGGGHKLP
jgi:hypothetical protein